MSSGAYRLGREDGQPGSIGFVGLPTVVGHHDVDADSQSSSEVQRVEAAEVSAREQSHFPVEERSVEIRGLIPGTALSRRTASRLDPGSSTSSFAAADVSM